MEIQENDMLEDFGEVKGFENANNFSQKEIEEIANLFYQVDDVIIDENK